MVFHFWNALTKILPTSSKGLSDAKTQWFTGRFVLALPDIRLRPTALHAVLCFAKPCFQLSYVSSIGRDSSRAHFPFGCSHDNPWEILIWLYHSLLLLLVHMVFCVLANYYCRWVLEHNSSPLCDSHWIYHFSALLKNVVSHYGPLDWCLDIRVGRMETPGDTMLVKSLFQINSPLPHLDSSFL